MLTLSHIRKDYGKFTAVEDINLELENGLYAMLAPNGAGKTTLIKMITTLLSPTSGDILYDGMDIYKMGETYRDVIGYLPQHFGYYKNSSISLGDDKFTINSVNVSLNSDDLYHTTVQTNSDGQAITQIPFGKYSITETKAPDGYWLNEVPTIVEFRSTDEAVHEFTIEDEAKAKLIVHHYIKGTTTKLADDENLEIGRAHV